jgi:UDP-3-O-[3-hydroxymyristoyl] glucosamine N-acyltransferase
VDLTLEELAALVGGQFVFDGTVPPVRITGAASVLEARAGDVTFFANARYLPALKASRASAVLVPLDFAENVPPLPIRCENPTLAFSHVLAKTAPPSPVFASGVHPTAVVHPGAKLGAEVSVQSHAVIEDGAFIGARTVVGAGSYIGYEARIGEDCSLASSVSVGARCLIGDRVVMHNGAVLGSDGFGFEFNDGRHVKIPQTGIVQIDDDVEIGANTTVDRARFGRTWIGEGTKIDNLVQIAHNVQIGKHCIICAQAGISGSVRIGDGVLIGGQVGIVGHIEVGSGAQIGAKSGVSKNVPPGVVWLGYPAMDITETKDRFARISLLPKLFQRVRRLEQDARETGKSLPPPS